MVREYTEPDVCIPEDLTTDSTGLLRIEPFATPKRVANIKGLSGADGRLYQTITLPGKLLIDIRGGWRNDTPLPKQMMIRCVRASKAWIASQPNAIQFRDRWTWTIDPKGVTPDMPTVTGIYNSQVGSAIDLGTNSVAEPNPGKQWMWVDCNMQDEWIGECGVGERVEFWYQQYVWNPPPYSDNANKNSPEHKAFAYWTRMELWAYPTQPGLVNS